MKNRLISAFSLAAVVLVLDLAAKFWAKTALMAKPPVVVIKGLFNLVYVENTGASFGFLNNPGETWQRWFLIAASILAIVVIIQLLRSDEGRDKFMQIGLGLIMGGAAGNLWDRVATGRVVDFLDFYFASHHWPAFNIADIAISIGAFMMIISFYQKKKKHESGSA